MSTVKYFPTRDCFEWVCLSKDSFRRPEGIVIVGYEHNGSPVYVGKVRPHHWDDNLVLPAKISYRKRKVYFTYDGIEWDAFDLPAPVEVWALKCPRRSTIAVPYLEDLSKIFGSVELDYPYQEILGELMISRYLYWVPPSKIGKTFRPLIGSLDPFMKAPVFIGRTSVDYEIRPGRHVPGRVVLQAVFDPYPRTEGIYIGDGNRQELLITESNMYEVLAIGPDRALHTNENRCTVS